MENGYTSTLRSPYYYEQNWNKKYNYELAFSSNGLDDTKNGVVMVADRKFTVNNGTDYEYDDKLWGDIGGVIAGFSGSRGSFELFRRGCNSG